MNKIYTRKIEFDFHGECVVEIPEEIVTYLKIEPNDVVIWEVAQDEVILRKRQEL
jgi:hypothetical protein